MAYDFGRLAGFYQDRKVFVTGHTGFKGSWMCRVLEMFGANILGYALEPPTMPSLYYMGGFEERIPWVKADIRNGQCLIEAVEDFRPEIIIHMAAQPIVRESYKEPVYTFDTNVMGTVNVCEAVRLNPFVRSFVNVTTDKVYDNKERREGGYHEGEPLDGYDPYSNSKSCSELVTHCYARSFFSSMDTAVSTARAGNVIGGGDFATDRIIPDCVRGVLSGQEIVVRNPHSVRPYQHVLDPVMAYLMLAAEQYEHREKEGCYNVGPDDEDCITTGQLTTLFKKYWPEARFKVQGDDGPHEAGFLKLDCAKLKRTFGWQPVWNVDKAVEKTVELSRMLALGNKNITVGCMDRQIREYLDV